MLSVRHHTGIPRRKLQIKRGQKHDRNQLQRTMYSQMDYRMTAR